MRKVAASFIAMATGWGILNLATLAFAVIETGGLAAAFASVGFWSVATGVVISLAWLFVFLPVYALVPTSSGFWRWGVCIPSGLLIGAIVPFGVIALLEGTLLDGGALIAMAMAGFVGGVAAVVGRWLFRWSRHYEADRPWIEVERGRRIPWLRV